ncbi:MAG: acyl-CoA dehydrogenase family protein [Myxococcales bacterium]|nr:acyl-CoA dehydrogenase family protein [Myxococcales bacterium]
MSSNFYLDHADLRFHVERGVDWASLVEVTEYGGRAPDAYRSVDEALPVYQALLGSMGALVARSLAPHAAKIEREGPRLVGGEVVDAPVMAKAFDDFREAGLHGLCLPRELGGMNAPLLVYFLGGEMIARADVSAMTHFSFHGGMAMAMLAYSIHEGSTRFDVGAGRIASTRFAAEIDEIARGDAWGCMDITEPNAGSDMAALATRAAQGADGAWRLNGQKIFITSGHGKYHFVIARTEPDRGGDDPMAGLKGLSMFLVRAWEGEGASRQRHVRVARLEEKLGHHGSVTAALEFDDAPAELIGQRGEGFKYMLTLMNNARVGVGFESLGLAESAYRMASAYAQTRRAMGKAIARHEMVAEMLDEAAVDIAAVRALAVRSAWHEEMSQKLNILSRFDAVMGEAERARGAAALPRHRRLARRYTPLLKYIAAEKAVEIARRNVQIHGGVGYTREYGAEKLLRDAMVLPIYEGTSQIQALMAMKDSLAGVMKRPQAFAAALGQSKWRALSARDPLERAAAHVAWRAQSAQWYLVSRTAAGKLKSLQDRPLTEWQGALTRAWNPKRDFALAMLHAERLTRLLADEAITEILLDEARRHPDRRALLEAYLDRATLRCDALYEEITTRGGRLLGALAAETLAAE